MTRTIIVNDRSSGPLFDLKGDGSGKMTAEQLLQLLNDEDGSVAEELRAQGVDVQVTDNADPS